MIRDAVAADAARCAEIYAPYVRETAISFEEEPPSAAAMSARIAGAQRAASAATASLITGPS